MRLFLRNKKALLGNKRTLLKNERAALGSKKAFLENKAVILENKRAILQIKGHFWEVKGLDLRARALAPPPLPSPILPLFFCGSDILTLKFPKISPESGENTPALFRKSKKCVPTLKKNTVIVCITGLNFSLRMQF